MPNDTVQAGSEAVPANPSDAAVATAMRSLEEQVIDLDHMANIAWGVFDETFTPDRTEERDGHQFLHFRILCDQSERASFAINDVCTRIGNLRRAYNAAYRGEVAK